MRRTKLWLRLITIGSMFVMGLALAPAALGEADPFPGTVALPDGFFPEGITIDDQTATGYVGSLVGGAIQRIDLRTGESVPFAPVVAPDALAVGMALDDHGRLWVAAGGPALVPTTVAGFRVYDTATGDLLLDQPVPAGFVNDVWLTDEAAWLTDSFTANLIRVPLGADGSIGAAELVPLGGDWVQNPGFNANGIVATADEKHLIVAQASGPEPGSSALFVMPADADAAVLEATRITLDDALLGGDGLVLIGRTLFVVGGPGVTKIRLAPGLANGTIRDVLIVPDAITPTTADAWGSRLYVVDAKFPFLGDPTTPFVVTAIAR